MMYQRYVSKKKRIRSIKYMIDRVSGMWFLQRAAPKILSLQRSMFVRAMTETGALKDDDKKKYDSTYLQPKTKIQRTMDAKRAALGRAG